MRKVFGPKGEDNTSAALTWLLANRVIEGMPDLFLIGEAGHPFAIKGTNYARALTWGPGTFPVENISRSGITSKISLDVQTLDITYSPINRNITQNVSTTSPIHLAQLGYYDGWPVRVWRAIMPTAGDVSTYGCFEVFGGRVASVSVDGLKIVFHVNCYLDALAQNVPANVIENTSHLASYAGAHPPAGFSGIPKFSVAAGSTETVLYLDCTSTPGHIFGTNVFRGGWLLFDFGAGETLSGFYSIIGANSDYVDGLGHHHNKVQIYTPLPWPPTPYAGSPALGDTCFVSAPFPVDQAEGTIGVDNFPFPYVPAPENAV